MLKEGSNYSLHNCMADSSEACKVTLRDQPPFEVSPGHEKLFGWIDPLGADMDRKITLSIGGTDVSFDPRVAQTQSLGGLASITSSLRGSCTHIEVHPSKEKETTKHTTTLEVMLNKIGPSIVSEQGGPTDFVYAELDLMRACIVIKPEEDLQLLDFSIADVQVDWQSATSEDAVVVVGNSGLSNSSKMDPFFRVVMERGRTSSPDMYIRAIRIDVDEFEVAVNDVLLTSMQEFMRDAFPMRARESYATMTGDECNRLATLRGRAGRSILEDGWEAPAPAKMVQIKEMFISDLKMTVWCSLRFKFLTFMPIWAKTLITSLTFSTSLSLEGSTLKLDKKPFMDVSGSAAQVGQALGREYTGDVLRSLGSILGNSSVLNIPRAPLKLAGAIARGGEGAYKLGDSFGAGFQKLTFDDDYCKKQQKLRAKRQIANIGDGFTEAISDLGDGMDGMLDIVRKPVQGAREGGFVGGVAGLGKGLLSSVVKPIGAVGSAMSDIGRGFNAAVSKMGAKKKAVTQRRRLPRLLAGPRGAIVEYSELDAWVMKQLQRRIEIIVPLARKEQSQGDREDLPSLFLLLVITPDAVLLEWLEMPAYFFNEHMVESDFALLKSLKDFQLPAVEENGIALEGAQASIVAGSIFHSRMPLAEVRWQECYDEAGVLPEIAMKASGEDGEFRMHVPWELGKPLAQALFKALQAATGVCKNDWTSALRRELYRARQATVASGQGSNTVIETVTVWEVERAEVAAGSASRWMRPFLPAELEQSYRWMDKDLLQRHPLLDPTVDASQCSEPPVVMLPIWTPGGKFAEWTPRISNNTDEEGWQYGTNWGTSAWGKKPRPFFDAVRRRKWTRTYCLHMLSNDDEFIGESWLHAKHQEIPNMWALFCAMTCCARNRVDSRGQKKVKKPPAVSVRTATNTAVVETGGSASQDDARLLTESAVGQDAQQSAGLSKFPSPGGGTNGHSHHENKVDVTPPLDQEQADHPMDDID